MTKHIYRAKLDIVFGAREKKMDQLLNVWEHAWASYHIEPVYLYVILAVAAICAYRDWQKTLLVLWIVVYAWTMTIALAPGRLDLEAGFLVVWVCGYGLMGFFFLGYLFYANLK